MERQERRKSVRYPKRHAAEAILGEREPPVCCVIWDISTGGARLAVARPLADMPDTFTLMLSKDAERRCQVVRKDTRFIYVRFI